jgi:hypothetical protein
VFSVYLTVSAALTFLNCIETAASIHRGDRVRKGHRLRYVARMPRQASALTIHSIAQPTFTAIRVHESTEHDEAHCSKQGNPAIEGAGGSQDIKFDGSGHVTQPTSRTRAALSTRTFDSAGYALTITETLGTAWRSERARRETVTIHMVGLIWVYV